MRLYVVLFVALSIARLTSCDSTFRFGGVLSSVGNTSEMAEAAKGYALYFDDINTKNEGRGFWLPGRVNTTGFHFKYSFRRRDDFGDVERHKELVRELLEVEKVHFLGGSHADYAREEMRLANEFGILNYHCCVEPNFYYDSHYPTVFGITASNEEYTKSLVRRLLLEEIAIVSVVYKEDDILTRTTCEAAIKYLREAGSPNIHGDSMLITTLNESSSVNEVFGSVVDKLDKHPIEGVFACLSPEEGKRLVDVFHDARRPLKAFFLTVGPTRQSWVDSFKPPSRANNLFSAAQWHPKMKYTDSHFGSTLDYMEIYGDKFSEEVPTHIAAGASAVGLTLTQAIKDAFRYCDISKTNGDVDALLYDPKSIDCDDQIGTKGYDRVLNALSGLDMETFFGRVKFNFFHRNVGLETVTTQVFERQNSSGEKYREIDPVMPLSYATSLPKLPADNPYKPNCEPGYHKGDDQFEECTPCPRGQASHDRDATHCESCPIGEWNNRVGQSSCNKCPSGTSTESRGAIRITACKCKPGFFTVAGFPGVECDPCPEGALCGGGLEPPIPEKGYWANNTNRAHIYQCDPAEVCLGGENISCAEGYTGRLCAECVDGYFSVIQKCYECLSPITIILLTIGLLAGWYVINVIVSRSVSSLEMILGWAQLANIIGDISLNWTKNVTTMFGVANILDFDVDILEPSCLLSWGFKQNFLVQLCLPFIMSLMAASGYWSSALAHFVMIKHKWIRLNGKAKDIFSCFVKLPENESELKMKWDATVAAFLASVDITYVTIAKYCFDVFKCEDIAGVSVLRVAPAVVCNDDMDYKILVVFASFGIVFYVIGYPMYMMWKLYDLHNRSAFSDPVNLRRSGFIYEKYELDYYFTPAINTIRKLLFVLVLVYMNNPAFQVGSMAILINASLMIHVYTAPYVDTYLDLLFSFLLVALMGEAFGGLMFYSENLPEANREILEWIIMTTMFLLTAVFSAIFIMEIRKKYHIRYIKKEHLKFVKSRFGPVCSIFSLRRSGSRQRSRSAELQRKASNISFELIDTFKPAFVYKSIRKRPDMIRDWDKLTKMLKEYMSDQSVTSYLSLNPIAKFWRKLVDRFPELVDFLAVTDDETRAKFKDFSVNLYRNFYLSNKVAALPLMEILNWRDYAPIAQWLAIAPSADREFFIETISEMFRANDKEEAAKMIKTRIEHGGSDPFLHSREPLRKLSRAQRRILTSINSGSHPLYHSACPTKRKSSHTFGLGISKLNFCQRKRTDSQKGERSQSVESVVSRSGTHEYDPPVDHEIDEGMKSTSSDDKAQQSVVNINCDATPQEISPCEPEIRIHSKRHDRTVSFAN